MLLDKLALALIEDKVVTDLSFQFPRLTAICSDGTSIVLDIGNACPSTTTSTTTTTTTTSVAGNETLNVISTVAGPGVPIPGSDWSVAVSGATPYSTFYFTSGAGFTSQPISIQADGTGTYGYFSYAAAGTYTVTAYFSGTGHTRTRTATVQSSGGGSSNPPSSGATYALNVNGSTSRQEAEGAVVTFTLLTTNVPNGTRLSYFAAAASPGITTEDASGYGGIGGGANFLTTGNSTTFQFTLVEDRLTEGPEWVEIAVCPYYTTGAAPAALSNKVRINITDTSTGTTTTTTTTTTTLAPSVPVNTVVRLDASQFWVVPAGWSRIRAIIVAGGGGGGTLGTSTYYDGGGGGGAGGVIDVIMDVIAGDSLFALIGAGGSAGDMNVVTGRGRNGGDSSFTPSFTSIGGGGGGGVQELTPGGTVDTGAGKNGGGSYVGPTYDFHGLPGGSGGGSTAPFAAQAGYNAPGTSGQGFAGGEAYDNGFTGAGGGAGSQGRGNGGLSGGVNKNSTGVDDAGVSGGTGLAYTFGSTSFVVGGGGGLGGCTWNTNPSVNRVKGGWGGGGNGSGDVTPSTAGAVNSGGGGGGGGSYWGGSLPASAGGSGVIYLVKI